MICGADNPLSWCASAGCASSARRICGKFQPSTTVTDSSTTRPAMSCSSTSRALACGGSS
jgi:hypothetical protein